MVTKQHIKEIENLLNKENIIKFQLLQISFGIACIELQLSNKEKYIAKFYINKKTTFNAIKSEARNLLYLNKIFNFFPKILKFTDKYLILEYFENDTKKPTVTNSDFLESVINIHSISNDAYGFYFNTQIGAVEQNNDFENSWVNFYANKRLYPMFELANKINNMGSLVNEKINFILKNIKSLIPEKPIPRLLHGDLWEGNILFKKNKFIGFIDPGSFFGHNEMEIAYLRWFNPSFIDSRFVEKYNSLIKVGEDFQDYEAIYQLYYSLCNVALWDKSYIEDTKRLLNKLKI